jgi:hypothetical protein
MISEKKIAANRLNAKKSTGPRTSRGKSRTSRNAWRHGWAVAKTGRSPVSANAERMAKAICGHHASPALYEQAVIIAECETVLLSLRAARVALVKRNSIIGRDLQRPNQWSCFSSDELTPALEALAGGELRPAIRLLRRQTRALRALMARVARAKGNMGVNESDRGDREGSSPQPATCPYSSIGRSDEDQGAMQLGAEVDAFRHALPELVSLERYERRALSRRTRAIRMFNAIATVGSFLDRETKGR